MKMQMNDDYFKLYLERVKSLNYLYDNKDENIITLPIEEYLSIFIIGEDNYNNQIMNDANMAFIESLFELEKIEIIQPNIKNILDIATTHKVSKELNKKIVYRCLDYYNKNNKTILNNENINIVLDSM